MARNVYRFKGNFKSFLFMLAVMITLGFLYYTQGLVEKLQKQSRQFQQFKVSIFEQSLNNEEMTDLSFFFNNVIQTADYPIITTDPDTNPQFWRNVGIPEMSSRPFGPDTLALLRKMVKEFDAINSPISINYQGSVLGYYHYGESNMIRQLRWLPVVEIIVVAMFILIGYAGFNSIKKSEERFIWVGMAKETAHQLGTPLSSQIGWLEYLKVSPEQLPSVIPELEKDLVRLQNITNRFSQIGSLPDMKPENLNEIIHQTVQYFRSRIPQKNGNTRLETLLPEEALRVKLNESLFSWVLENLIKNGLDAMENKGGSITIEAGTLHNSQVYIDVKDTGKGIDKKDKKNIFKPGFSTKKRGWGLGLSLAKRIVEEYHGGRLTLKESHQGEGSTFRIILNGIAED